MKLLDQDAETGSERWTVSYADFMTLLFALFVVLFASSHHKDRDLHQASTSIREGFQQLGTFPGEITQGASSTASEVPSSIGRSANVDVVALQQDLAAALGKEIAHNEVVLRMTPDGFVISLRELGFFNSGDATLLSGAEPKIQRIATILTRYGLSMRVEGHTDNLPIHTAAFKSNWDLSIARASNVAMMLIDHDHFEPGRMSVAGYGEYHPISSNDTPEGRQANRRVDIVIITTTKPAEQ